MYTVLARSLAEGHGYRFLNLPGEPNATHFPPGYPLVLALLWKVAPPFPDNLVVFKFANAAFLGATAVGCHRFVRRRFGASIASSAVAGVAGTLSVVVLVIAGVILSEPLFMAILFPALLAAERAADHPATPRDAAIAGAWIGALGIVRTIGAFAVPAAALVLVLQRRWRSALVLCAVSALFLAPWELWVALHSSEIPAVFAGKFGAYGQWLTEGYRVGGMEFARNVVGRNLEDIAKTLSFVVLPVTGALPRFLTLAVLVAFVIAGAFRFRRKAPITLAFLALYMLVVVLWPFHPSRFLLAIWPLFLPLVASGVVTLWQAPLTRLRLPVRSAIVFGAIVCVSGYGWYNAIGYSRRWWEVPQREAGQRAKPIVEWVAANTPRDAVLSTEDDLIVYLYAGRKAVPTATFTAQERLRLLTDREDLDYAREIFRNYQPDYYIVNSRQGERTAESLVAEGTSGLRYFGNLATVRIYSRLQP